MTGMIFTPPLFRLKINENGELYKTDCVMIFHMVRIFASGVGAALYTIIWHRREVFYHSRLSEHLSRYQSVDNAFYPHGA